MNPTCSSSGPGLSGDTPCPPLPRPIQRPVQVVRKRGERQRQLPGPITAEKASLARKTLEPVLQGPMTAARCREAAGRPGGMTHRTAPRRPESAKAGARPQAASAGPFKREIPAACRVPGDAEPPTAAGDGRRIGARIATGVFEADRDGPCNVRVIDRHSSSLLAGQPARERSQQILGSDCPKRPSASPRLSQSHSRPAGRCSLGPSATGNPVPLSVNTPKSSAAWPGRLHASRAAPTAGQPALKAAGPRFA